MMDYELHIKIAERELAHLREMKKLQDARLDRHDRALEEVDAVFGRIEKNMEIFSEGMKAVQAAQFVTGQRLESLAHTLQEFIQVLARSHGNGKT